MEVMDLPLCRPHCGAQVMTLKPRLEAQFCSLHAGKCLHLFPVPGSFFPMEKLSRLDLRLLN
jgi:hypothetical protein